MPRFFTHRANLGLPTLAGLVAGLLLGCDSAQEPVAVKPPEPLVARPTAAAPAFDLAPWQAAQID